MATAFRRQVDRRTARTAPDFQHMAALAHLCLIGESKPLCRGEPAALPDVLAEGIMPHRSFCAACEVGVDVVV